MRDDEARKAAEGLSRQARSLLLLTEEGKQIYQYPANAARALVKAGLLEEHWTWVSSTRPGVERTARGSAVARHCFSLSIDSGTDEAPNPTP